MRITVELPAGWPLHLGQDGLWRAQVPVGAGPPLALAASPLAVRPDNLNAWAGSVAQVEGPATQLLVELSETTAQGWPMRLLECDYDGGRERRLYAFYHFLDYAGHVALIGDPARVAAAREEVLAVLRGAQPDWSTDEVVALVQLWV